ncbi:MAG: mercuric reductase [Rhodospirillaceae bacterium]|nr:mercuric reductase [Rhodospirillaceae bacterium]
MLTEKKVLQEKLRSAPVAPFFTLGGIAAAFGVASCCALPLLLASAGLGASWLVGFATLAAPHRDSLLVASALALGAAAALLFRQQWSALTCKTDQPCVSRASRILTLLGLILGTSLLWAGYAYA